MARKRHTKSGPRNSQFGTRAGSDPLNPTDSLQLAIARFQDNLATLTGRVRAVVNTLDEINRLADRKAKLELRITNPPASFDEDQKVRKRRDRLQARIDRLYGPIPQVQADLHQSRSSLRKFLATLPIGNPRSTMLREEIERLPWPTPPGFNQPR
ncbi:MAG: hypothetical protein IH602_08425 [Bryobacteraceae bacterium]|nr:hypothetical protein [Bryobacteraceae bacterium]